MWVIPLSTESYWNHQNHKEAMTGNAPIQCVPNAKNKGTTRNVSTRTYRIKIIE